jgi:hypothetical protein
MRKRCKNLNVVEKSVAESPSGVSVVGTDVSEDTVKVG